MKYTILIAFSIFSYSVFGQPNLIGTWNTGQDNTIIEITEIDGIPSGKIKTSDNPKAAIGNVILKDVKKKGEIWKGKIYAAKRQEWYDAEISQKGNVIKIEISVGFFSKTVVWKKT
jgi:hypothetical protein